MCHCVEMTKTSSVVKGRGRCWESGYWAHSAGPSSLGDLGADLWRRELSNGPGAATWRLVLGATG